MLMYGLVHATGAHYSPSDHSTLQIVNLDEFPKAAGVVVVGRLGVPKGLARARERQRV